MQTDLYYYNLARKDFKRGQIPQGARGFTPGQRAILGQGCYKNLWSLQEEVDQVDNQKTEKLTDMVRFQKFFDDVSEVSSDKLEQLKSDLKDVNARVELKKEELEEFVEDMSIRGVALNVARDGVSENMAENTHKNAKAEDGKKWLQSLFIIGIYMIIEGFTYFTQFESLREIKSIEAIGARVLAMGIMVGAFHVVSKLNRMARKPIYIAFLAVNLTMIFCTMVLPITLNVLYPESSIESSSEWSLAADDTATTASTQENSTQPIWVILYNKMDWVPAVVVLLFFLVVFFVVPNSITGVEKQADNENSYKYLDTNSKADGASETEAWSPQSEYGARIKELKTIESKRKELQAKIEEEEKSVLGLIPCRDQLLALKETVISLDSRRKSLFNEVKALLKELDNELKEYQAEYEALLAKDEAKAQLINPEWPEEKNLFNYFK